jgi:hypothetical protein
LIQSIWKLEPLLLVPPVILSQSIFAAAFNIEVLMVVAFKVVAYIVAEAIAVVDVIDVAPEIFPDTSIDFVFNKPVDEFTVIIFVFGIIKLNWAGGVGTKPDA